MSTVIAANNTADDSSSSEKSSISHSLIFATTRIQGVSEFSDFFGFFFAPVILSSGPVSYVVSCSFFFYWYHVYALLETSWQRKRCKNKCKNMQEDKCKKNLVCDGSSSGSNDTTILTILWLWVITLECGWKGISKMNARKRTLKRMVREVSQMQEYGNIHKY